MDLKIYNERNFEAQLNGVVVELLDYDLFFEKYKKLHPDKDKSSIDKLIKDNNDVLKVRKGFKSYKFCLPKNSIETIIDREYIYFHLHRDVKYRIDEVALELAVYKGYDQKETLKKIDEQWNQKQLEL